MNSKHDATHPKVGVNDTQILQILTRLLNDYVEGLLSIKNARLLGKCVISIMNMENKLCSDGPLDKAYIVISRKQIKS